MKILISDANSHNRENLASFLLETGLEVVGTAAFGKETLKLAKELNPEIIILDVNLPDVDALELIASLKSSHSPSIVITLLVSHNSIVEHSLLQAGAHTCLAKNEGIDPLIGAIQSIQNSYFQGE